MNRKLHGPQNRYGRYREEKNLYYLPGIVPWASNPQPVAIPTELSRLKKYPRCASIRMLRRIGVYAWRVGDILVLID
jgi:hypothetical protein